jgi:pyrroline-5-carboxylate reductase
MHTLFIGGGNMATALIGSLISHGTWASDVRVVEPQPQARERLAERFPGLHLHPSVSPEAAVGAELVVLAVKPQQMREAVAPLAPHVAHVEAVLTIAAGIRLDDLSRWLGGCRRLVRAMPNTPALVGAGVTGVYAWSDVPERAKGRVDELLAAAGDVVWCPREESLDAITAVSGTGPAYVFYFLEGLMRAAMEQGFGAADARRLAYGTFSGAVKLAEASELAPAKLREQVTSKGGTTERAIATLNEAGVQDSFVRAVHAAAVRAKELGDAFGKDG